MKSFREILEEIVKHLGVDNPFFIQHGPDEETITHEHGMQLHKRPDKHITEDEHKAMHSYSEGFYRDINHILRNQNSWKKMRNDIGYKKDKIDRNLKDFKEYHIPNIDKTISHHTTEHPATVWRGINPENIKTKEGTVLSDKGFTSTTLHPAIAIKFGRESLPMGNRDNIHIAKINLPKGSKAVYLNQNNLSSNKREHEVLLPRNSKFRYEGSSTHPHPNNDYETVTVHHLTHLPEES
jgi:hypothetical protein